MPSSTILIYKKNVNFFIRFWLFVLFGSGFEGKIPDRNLKIEFYIQKILKFVDFKSKMLWPMVIWPKFIILLFYHDQ